MEKWYTAQEIADMLATYRERIWNSIKRGELVAVDIAPPGSSRPTWRVSQDALDNWLASRSNRKPAPKPKRRKKRREQVTEFIT